MQIDLEQAVAALLAEQVVAVPTETVYGLAALATSARAIARIYEVKARPQDNPLICHFWNREQILTCVQDVPEYWQILCDVLSPGPVSYRLPLPTQSPLLPAVAGQSTVVCRIPDQPLCLEVIRQVGVPLAAPSANTSGKVSPTTADMVERDLGSRIAGVLDGGPCSYGLESTILDCCEPHRISILRPGAIGLEEIKTALQRHGFSQIVVVYTDSAQDSVVPGNKYRHYAPNKPLFRVHHATQIPTREPVWVLMSQEQHESCLWPESVHPVLLGSRHNLPKVAQHLYQQIESLDHTAAQVGYYWQEDWGDSSLGRAIANRLNRASQPI